MKKSLILFFFLNFSIIACYDIEDLIFKGKCEDNKSKTGACIYKRKDYDSKGNTEYAIFKKCGNGEKCDISDEICVKNYDKKKRKTGQSCNYDEDCITHLCVSNKCIARKENEKCKYYDTNCELGLSCSYDSSDTGKCVKFIKEGSKIDKVGCMPGLGADIDGKCVKYGSIDNKVVLRKYDYSFMNHYSIDDYEDLDLNLLCKSGLYHRRIDTTNGKLEFVCDTVEKEAECKEDSSIPKTNGKWGDESPIDDGCNTEEDYNGKKIYYSDYSKLKSKLFEDFITDYNKLDLEKLNSDEKYGSWKDGMKTETKEKLILYNYANELKAAGIIDSDGKVVKDKKCEYEFLIKNVLHSNSNYIKLNTIIIAIIALLLF